MTDPFELISQLGRGGMGVVWKARDVATGEIVAVKLLHALLADDADYVARFEREVEIGRRIVSPHVVQVLGFGRRDGVPYLTMEYVDGESLKELVKARGRLSWDEARPILRQVADGLQAAHDAGVIHRDMKPSNILIAPDGTAKVADFGIAKAADMTALTGSATMLGTPSYMAPEATTTVASDWYAFGCIAYEMLAGTPPFTGDTMQQVLMKHMRDDPDLSKLPVQARAVVAALLDKDPERRMGAIANSWAMLGPSTPDEPNDIQFELLSQLRRGGLGTIWKARKKSSGEIVAVEVLHALFADDADYVARMERQVLLARRINSDHVVRVLGLSRRNDAPCLISEWFDGQSLHDLLKARDPLKWEEARPVLRQVAQALQATHAAGIVHRNIKPANILVAADGFVKLADVECARADVATASNSSQLIGNGYWMAPEGTITPAADWYSLGCIAFEMLTGTQPFSGDTMQQVLAKQMYDGPDLAKVPPPARAFVSALLEKDPERRIRIASDDGNMEFLLEGRSYTPLADGTDNGDSPEEDDAGFDRGTDLELWDWHENGWALLFIAMVILAGFGYAIAAGGN